MGLSKLDISSYDDLPASQLARTCVHAGDAEGLRNKTPVLTNNFLKSCGKLSKVVCWFSNVISKHISMNQHKWRLKYCGQLCFVSFFGAFSFFASIPESV